MLAVKAVNKLMYILNVSNIASFYKLSTAIILTCIGLFINSGRTNGNLIRVNRIK